MITVNQIANLLNGKVIGDGERVVKGISSWKRATESQIAYVTDKYISKIENCTACALVVPETDIVFNVYMIQVKNPRLAFITLASLFKPTFTTCDSLVDSTAVISEGSTIGSGTVIGAHSYIGKNVKIGRNMHISSECNNLG